MSKSNRPREYLTHIPVRSYLEADVLSRESTWNILGHVRMAGAAGATTDEIAKTLGLPPSAVYSTLKELRRLEFVSILPRAKKRRAERKKRYLCTRTTWGKYRINGQFVDALAYEGATKKLTEALEGPLLQQFSRLFDEFGSKSALRPYLPERGDGRICPICDKSHEATEFAYAVLLAVLDPFITESPEFRNLLIEKGYAR